MTSVSAHSDVTETCSIYQTVTHPYCSSPVVIYWSQCHRCEVDEPHTDETAATTWCRTHRCIGEEDE